MSSGDQTARISRRAKKLIVGAAAALLVISGVAVAQVRNSQHDFSTSGKGGKWGSPDVNQVCVFCHTPHRAAATLFLWNRNNPTANFQLYSNPGSLVSTPSQPTEYSRRCLSCHDGSVAIDAINVGRTGVPRMLALGDIYYPGSPYGNGGANIGGNYTGNNMVNDLSDDHPVSILYDSTLSAANQRLRDPAGVTLPLYQKRVECSSCHDVHNGSGGFPYLLRASLDQSELCLKCHVK
jgi:predicted CXXCH cytochrome family protein